MTTDRIVRWCSAVAATALMVGATAAQANATFVIYNADGPGEGFNDPTPATPVGGNPGTTLGQQRINAFQHAASVWGGTLDSTVPITIVAAFNPLSCNATSAVLGSAGPRWIFSDFPGAPVPGTWYHASLTSKLAGEDPVPDDAMISAQFNSNLGQVGCLTGSPFYLGLDGNHGNAIDLVTVLLHEFGHGLGFSTVTNGGTGAQLGGQPSIYDHFAYDNVLGKTWVAMTDAERAFSATNPRQLAWNGPNVTGAAPTVLERGTPVVQVEAPREVKGRYLVGPASFGAPFDVEGVDRQVVPVVEAGTLGTACVPFDDYNRRAAKERIVMVFRGTCTFTVKVKNAQDAGAKAVLVVDNTLTSPPAGLGGADPTITIPSGRITFTDGVDLLDAMRLTDGGRSSGVVVKMRLDMKQRAGTDVAGRVLLYTPNPRQPGSSVSHWDDSASPNLLMEPAINADLTQILSPPIDLTSSLMRDIGW